MEPKVKNMTDALGAALKGDPPPVTEQPVNQAQHIFNSRIENMKIIRQSCLKAAVEMMKGRSVKVEPDPMGADYIEYRGTTPEEIIAVAEQFEAWVNRT